VIQGSFPEVFERSFNFQGQFPLYYILMWGWTRLAGASEIALRLPSVASVAVATWASHRIALRLIGPVQARLAACVFVLLPPVAFLAGDARPYALAIATLLGATLALVHWLETERARAAISCLVLVALTLYLHYLFALALIPHAFFAAKVLREKGRRPGRILASAVAIVGILMLPAVPHLLDVYGRRRAMSLFTYGSIPELLAWVVPPTLVFAFLVARFARVPSDDPPAVAAEVPRRTLMFLWTWLLLPPTTLFAVGAVSGIGLFAQRHLSSSIPALALLAGSGFALLAPRRQRIGIVIVGILAVLMQPGPHHTPWHSDWRGAAQAANAVIDRLDTPILVYSGFGESREMAWVLDEEQSQLFLAPLAAYPVEGRAYPLPFSLTDEAERYVSGIIAAVAPDAEQIVLISTELKETYDVWLAERTSALGYRGREVGDFGDIRVLVFER